MENFSIMSACTRELLEAFIAEKIKTLPENLATEAGIAFYSELYFGLASTDVEAVRKWEEISDNLDRKDPDEQNRFFKNKSRHADLKRVLHCFINKAESNRQKLEEKGGWCSESGEALNIYQRIAVELEKAIQKSF